jgi:predicted transcriptional regulator
MATRHSITFTVPPEMHRLVERVRKTEQRTTTELMREALRYYFARVAALPTYTPTKAELRSIARGRADVARGAVMSLAQLDAYLDRQRHGTRREGSRPRPTSRATAPARRAR